MNKPDGGPAFPVPETAIMHPTMGMTLRDWFAGTLNIPTEDFPTSIDGAARLLGIEKKDFDGNTDWPKVSARLRYQHADAMIAEREEQS